jgi:hypothetical protein
MADLLNKTIRIKQRGADSVMDVRASFNVVVDGYALGISYLRSIESKYWRRASNRGRWYGDVTSVATGRRIANLTARQCKWTVRNFFAGKPINILN